MQAILSQASIENRNTADAVQIPPAWDFAAAIRAAGLGEPAITADGQLHRFRTPADKAGQKTGWYVLHLNGTPAGSFGDWRSGVTETWSAKPDPDAPRQTAQERAHRRRAMEQDKARREADERTRQAQAARQACDRWHAAHPAPADHPYLTRKGIPPFIARVENKSLLIPVYGADGTIQSLQTITPDGDKRFLSGGRMHGGWCEIQTGKPDAPLAIVEGYATGCSVALACPEWRVISAFNAGNLLSVAYMARAAEPARLILIAGDDDTCTPGNPGRTKGTAAASEIGARAVFPAGVVDWNDFHQAHGLEATRAALLDAGTATDIRHKPHPGPDSRPIPPALKTDLKALADADADAVQALARKMAARHAWRCPVSLASRELADLIASAHPAIDRGRIARFLAYLEREAAKAATHPLDAAPLPANVTYRDVRSLDEARALAEARPGIYLLKAIHAAGKTEAVLRPLAQAAASCVAIAPLVSLVSALCHRDALNLEHYQTTPDHAPAHLGICVNSIILPRHQASLDSADVVLIDEVAATIRAIHARKGTMAKRGKAVADRLFRLIDGAQTVMGVDADLDPATVGIIARALPERTITVLEYRPNLFALAAEFGSEARADARLDDAMQKGIPTMVVCDSAAKVETLTAAMRARYRGRRIVEVHSIAGRPTTGTDAVQALLADINQGVEGVDLLIMSPAVQSGVSLKRAHFQRHIAYYSGVITPAAFNQAIRRDRTAARWEIAICRTGERELIDSPAKLLNALDATARRTVELSNGIIQMIPASAFDWDVCVLEAQDNADRSRYAAGLWHLLTARGWTCTRAPEATDDERDASNEVKDLGVALADDAYEIAVMLAPDRPQSEVDQLRLINQPSPETAAIIARFDLKASMGLLPGEPLERWHLALWRRGKLAGYLKWTRLLNRAQAVSERDQAESEAGVTLILRAHEAATAEAIREFFTASGIDPDTGTGTVDQHTARATFHTLAGTTTAAILQHAGLASFEREPIRPVAWLSRVFGRLGLKLAGRQAHSGERRYSLLNLPSLDRRGRIAAPGWQAIQSLIAGDKGATVTALSLAIGEQKVSVAGTEERLRACAAWLDSIDEDDPPTRFETLRRCLMLDMGYEGILTVGRNVP